MRILTSAIPHAEIGESPQVSQSDGVAHAGEKEVQFASPVSAVMSDAVAVVAEALVPVVPVVLGTKLGVHGALFYRCRL